MRTSLHVTETQQHEPLGQPTANYFLTTLITLDCL